MHNSLSIRCVLPLNLPLNLVLNFIERQRHEVIVVYADIELCRIELLHVQTCR